MRYPYFWASARELTQKMGLFNLLRVRIERLADTIDVDRSLMKENKKPLFAGTFLLLVLFVFFIYSRVVF